MIDIITDELGRNISLALLVIFICTFILVMELATSLLVLLAVGLTIVDTAGFLQFWGLFLDQDFAIFLTISIGLCVDYSAHVAHCFMVTQGSRDERMLKTLTHIGPAVFNGGLSTFCAFVLLAFSKSQTFLAFFKVFFLVVSFGLFHGLIFLPVVLSLIGPKSQHLDIADEPEDPQTWAEKTVSNIGFEEEKDGALSVEQEARLMFSKQRKASIYTTVFDSDEVQSISPSELELNVEEEDAGERTEVESVASEKDLYEAKSEVTSLTNSARGSTNNLV